MVNELTKLLNTLATIETKGVNTKTMADCLRFLEQLIEAEQNKPVAAEPVPVEEPKPAKKTKN